EAEKLARRAVNAAKRPSDLYGPSDPSANEALRVNYMEEFERTLGGLLGRRVRIVNRRGNNGRFEIEYYGDEDFERLYNGLTSLGEGQGA
ncbi:MAG: hypothetical protein LBT36_05830, partial [Oscillospiraceae bacterium]|nr:hypothetical protein [Oscillospiraceae bacterium]